MGRQVPVQIDSEDLADMFLDRLWFWENSIPYGEDAIQVFCDYYATNINDGVYDNMKDFNINVIVDNDVINNIDVADESELANYGIDLDTDEGYDRILYSDGKLFLIDARA